uniref:Photosystem II 10 kDa polypeptide, chloroplastic n=1 Tax=Tetraselmis chuii TaxID=63592 RepID=A0A7S1X8S9_9CHLO|mmetsp:Transcript_43244/g.77493  ORF Transcript_43244/g.77493 Transcript_43244/m.77493 type:complete len:144 (+) Transcript_43244:106-537(+)|eukprot:CAMPEP_0168626016 /NCGR_PEP_ID=MMETSP0449_2-20121227/10378_1 /TAXON_ID=1082188 /ORGANISM="Strombidium rassoulzadegani, Strain ras09" /LENGTH=143 /DNA_ID=CAMNT_0008667925 /DNA_START=92 /DNA_END=523 /DNA_ORIENTATION=+
MAAIAQTNFLGASLKVKATRGRNAVNTQVVASGKKIDLKKQGLNKIGNATVQKNLMGVSDTMKGKDWKDPQGRKGKGMGVYKFQDKYGANVDGYSPIYTPDTWSESGESYKLGTKGLIAWAGLLVVGLAVAANLIYSTSQLGN